MYKIIFCLKNINVKEYKEKLNNILIEKVKNSMLKNKNKVEEEHRDYWGSIPPSLPIWIKEKLKCNYLPDTDCVIDYVLCKKEDITQKIINTKLKNEIDKENIETAKELIELGCINKEDIEIPY